MSDWPSYFQRIVLCVFLFTVVTQAQVTFTEVMYDLEGADYHDEFLEIFNDSDYESIDLSQWKLRVGDTWETLREQHQGMLLQPQSYAVILDGSYPEHSDRYAGILPDSVLTITIGDNAFGKSGLPNREGVQLTLVNSDGETVDSYTYSADNPAGYSDEKIVIGHGNHPDNWGNATQAGGTPGYRNSIAPAMYDLGILPSGIRIPGSDSLRSDKPFEVVLTIYNRGLNVFNDNLSLSLFIDIDGDTLFGDHDIAVYQKSGPVRLAVDDSLTVATETLVDVAGVHRICARLSAGQDQKPENNMIQHSLTIAEHRTAVVINEIKFLTADEPEWIELLNTGTETISLQGWSVCDAKDTCVIDTPIIIMPGAFKVLASAPFNDEKVPENIVVVLNTFPGLNNDFDTVTLLHPVMYILERVPYHINWLEGEAWRLPSLERIHPDLEANQAGSWGPSNAAAGGTPGKPNSIHAGLPGSGKRIEIKPDPFSPDGDGFEDHTLITVRESIRSGKIRVFIYDLYGRRIRTLEDNRFYGSRSLHAWDGKNDQGKTVRMGIYVVYVQIIDDRNGRNIELKATVTVAKPL